MANHPIIDSFMEIYGKRDRVLAARAPGRVNLIGEHTDYNEGFVFPMAINYGIEMAAGQGHDGQVNLYSLDYNQKVSFQANEPIRYDNQFLWSNYLRGIFWVLKESGYQLPGVDLVFGGDLPQGAGLSSSAALEVVTLVILQNLLELDISPTQLALLGQKAENEFVGMKCGIMDQFVVMMGKEGQGLFLDCRTLQFEQVPLELGEYQFVICHSGVKHHLVTSEYNRRREECETGVMILKTQFPEIKTLRDAGLEQLNRCKDKMPPESYRRCYHIITENQRVLESVAALKGKNLSRFGELMNGSHLSQRDYFEVSCPEIELLVKLAGSIPGVIGSRLTGGGFGGCTVNLVSSQAVDSFKEQISKVYQSHTNIEPGLYVCRPADGVKIIR